MQNTRIVLKNRPSELPDADTFRIEKTEFDPNSYDVVSEVIYVSVDPVQRMFLDDRQVEGMPPVKIGGTMHSLGLARVVRVKPGVSQFAVGDIIHGMVGWQTHLLCSSAEMAQFSKIDKTLDFPTSGFLSILGLTGLTAYVGIHSVSTLKKGDNVLVTAAAGATGSIAVQLAKLEGCRVVGTAGSDKKCAWLKEIGADDTINYKTCTNLSADLKEKFPNGIDFVFENVGGPTLDCILGHIAVGARIVICGGISQYNLPPAKKKGLLNTMNLVMKNASMTGFMVTNYASEFPEIQKKLAVLVSAGKLKYKDAILEGLDQAPRALLNLFSGLNDGKSIVKVADTTVTDPTAKHVA